MGEANPPETLAHNAGPFSLAECEGWGLLRQHLELSDGFSLVTVTAPDDEGVVRLRNEFPSLLPAADAWQHLVFEPSAPPESLAELLLSLPLPAAQVKALWLDAEPGAPESLSARDDAWSAALSRLNRYRNSISSRLNCTLILAIPVRVLPILRASAPDIWAIRSGLFRIEPPGINRSLIQKIGFEEISLPAIERDFRQTLLEADKLRGKPGRELLLAQLLHRAGNQARKALSWREAEKALEEAYILVQNFGADPEERINLSLSLGGLFHEEANFKRSEFYLRRAVDEAEQYLGSQHVLTSVALNDLAQLLQATNRLAEAEPLMCRALAIDEASFGKDHPRVAVRLNNLAQLLQATNRLAEAEPLMRRALAIDEASFGKDHPNVARDLNNLALLLQYTNRYAETEPLMRRALAIDGASFGKDHPDVARDLNNLASLLQATDRYAEAEPLMRRALAIDEASFGKDHPDVAIDLNNLARLLQDTNRFAEAEPLMRRALAIAEASFVAGHPSITTIRDNLEDLLKKAEIVVDT